MKVFLSGKMDAVHGAWRDQILDKKHSRSPWREYPGWEIGPADFSWQFEDVDLRNPDEYPPPDWPESPNRLVLGLHDYVGPYRFTYPPGKTPESEGYGYFHGSSYRGHHGQMSDEDQAAIRQLCYDAISRCDMFFAFINTPDCFGTLAEIGLAIGLGKYVHVAVTDDAGWEVNDFWLVQQMATAASDHANFQRRRAGYIGLYRNDPLQGERDWDKYVRLYHDEPWDHEVRLIFERALVQWTGRVQQSSPVTLVRPLPSDISNGSGFSSSERQELVRSFGQIAQWTSDPRVRDEARRMLSLLAGA